MKIEQLLPHIESYLTYDFQAKIFTGFTLAIITLSMTFKEFFVTYIFADFDFLYSLGIFVAIDSLTGFFQAVKNRRVKSSSYASIFTKIIVYAIILTICHGLQRVAADQFAPIKGSIYIALMVRESISILENIGKINRKYVPAFIRKYLTDLQEDIESPKQPQQGNSQQ